MRVTMRVELSVSVSVTVVGIVTDMEPELLTTGAEVMVLALALALALEPPTEEEDGETAEDAGAELLDPLPDGLGEPPELEDTPPLVTAAELLENGDEAGETELALFEGITVGTVV